MGGIVVGMVPFRTVNVYSGGLGNDLRSLQLPEIMPCVIHILCVMALKVLLTVGGFEAACVSNSIFPGD